VLGQTYPNWELLVVDDASTDDTGAIVQGMRDPRIRYIRVDSIGTPAGVRNVGLRHSRGAYLAFLDADDVYWPEALSTLLSALRIHPEYSAVYGFANNMDVRGNPLPLLDRLEVLPNGRYQLPDGYRHTWEEIFVGDLSCLLSALMLPRETLDRVGGFNEAAYSAEDYAFYVHLFLDRFEGVACLPTYIYRYRQHAASLTKTPEQMERVLASCMTVIDQLFQSPVLPVSALKFRSRAIMRCYSYLARERLINRQPGLAREIALLALKNRDVVLWDWLKKGLPLLLRSVLPGALDSRLIALRRTYRQTRFRGHLMTGTGVFAC
jgi:glycosyltransferase involved in cell wall biosynthesis